MLRLLAARVKPAIVAYAEACPQHAYLPGRSTQGALLWIFGRCRQIRDKAQAARYDIYSKRAGCSVKAYSGGFVLSLDLTSAFDLVPRDAIQASLREALICSLLALTNGHLQDLPSWRRLLQG